MPFLKFITIIYILHLGLISTLYNVPEKAYKKSLFPLRSIPLLKVFLIAYVWASVSAILPIIDLDKSLNLQNVLVFLMQFLFIFSITLPFDIRDFRTDYKKRIITTPHVIGIKATKTLALLSLVAFNLLFIHITGSWIILYLTLIAGSLIVFSNPARKDHYFTFFMDGTIIIYFILVLFFKS